MVAPPSLHLFNGVRGPSAGYPMAPPSLNSVAWSFPHSIRVAHNYCSRSSLKCYFDRPRSYMLARNARLRIRAMVRDIDEDHAPTDAISDIVENAEAVARKTKIPERDFSGTAYVPVYVMLPLGVINRDCELVNPDSLLDQLKILKSVNVDGVMVDCWWGIVEDAAPQSYNWKGYRQLFQMVRDLKLKLQVVMSFHECGGNTGDDVHIPLPSWVNEIGTKNPHIFFTDREGRHNSECLTWGIDKERVLRGRTAVEVCVNNLVSSLLIYEFSMSERKTGISKPTVQVNIFLRERNMFYLC
ncbi:hypothetical protein SAY86_004246 [Trapa natans]|uniref:Beta-amylase n=1 Tax=Trapa natans TaxID=22666 RepID=A0AAN7MFB4_TRANT|nr:hypothetical protein SAY86_004246 [Trapa natans]